MQSRTPKVLFVATLLLAMSLAPLALMRRGPSDIPEVRLTRLLERPGRLADEYAQGLSETLTAGAKTWMAEFQIQIPSKSRIWLTDDRIGVEIRGERGRWKCVV